MFCNNCGNQIPDHVKFCPKCGMSTGETVTQPQHPNYGYQPAPQQEQPNYSYQPAPQQEQPNYGYQPAPQQEQPNYSYQPAPQPKPQKPRRAKAPVKVTAGQRVISVILCIFIFIFSFAACFIGVTRATFTSANIRNMCSAGDLTALKITDGGTQKTVAEYLVGNINSQVVDYYKIDENRMNRVLSDSRVNSVVADFVNDYAQLFIFGKKPLYLSEDGVLNELKKLDTVLSTNLNGYSFSGKTDTSKDIIDIKNDMAKGGKLAFLNERNLQDILHVDPYLISNAFSVWVMIVLILLAVALTVLLFLVNKWRIQPSFQCFGVTAIVIGGVFLAIALGALIVSFVFNIYFLGALLRTLAIPSLIFGLVFTAVGVVLVLIAHFMKKRAKALSAEKI